MTNGEKIKELFPNAEYLECEVVMDVIFARNQENWFDLEWWNAEYKEPRKGHWIDTNYHQYYNDGEIETAELRCSCCGEEVEWDIALSHKPYFCENCGSDNRGEEE